MKKDLILTDSCKVDTLPFQLLFVKVDTFEEHTFLKDLGIYCNRTQRYLAKNTGYEFGFFSDFLCLTIINLHAINKTWDNEPYEYKVLTKSLCRILLNIEDELKDFLHPMPDSLKNKLLALIKKTAL